MKPSEHQAQPLEEVIARSETEQYVPALKVSLANKLRESQRMDEKSRQLNALDHQREALDEIISRARAYFRGNWRHLPILPRWATLIAGPTGSGKTTLAKMVAESVGATLIRYAAPNWMPSGAHNRGTKETMGVIAEHIWKNQRTILFLDEIDKIVDMTGDSSWKSYIRAEIFDLIDGRFSTGLNLPETEYDSPEITIEELTTKLQTSVFVLAAGTFQSWFDSPGSRRSMGFEADVNPAKDELTADIIAEKIPRELSNRFNSSLIRLPELNENEYHRIAREAENKIPEHMRRIFREEVERRINAAIAAKKGVRFLEEAMTSTLVKLPPEPVEKIPEKVETETPCI
ncbi:MAG: AAA family ATPase [Akkermansiaceae bacterium]|jgi:DNA polymerase III delta prime subunit